jgi:hypothetical protein
MICVPISNAKVTIFLERERQPIDQLKHQICRIFCENFEILDFFFIKIIIDAANMDMPLLGTFEIGTQIILLQSGSKYHPS